MINKKVDEIDISDLQLLIDNEIGESKSIEYKSQLNIETSEERKEFLADVSSFANCNGGDLLFGIKEDPESKLPCELCGIYIKSEDEQIRQLESLLRDSIQPRITDIQYHVVKVNDTRYVLIIRIPTSNFAPHRVIYRGHDKFYTRNPAGKYPMDVNELRMAFNHSQELSEKIDKYKTDRLLNAAANKYSWLAEGYPIFAFISIPTSAFSRDKHYSISEIQDALKSINMSAFDIAYQRQITVDGVRLVDSYNKGKNRSAYGHCFASGVVELFTTHFFNPSYTATNISPTRPSMKLIYRSDIIDGVRNLSNEILSYYRKLDMPAPISASCAIINGQGFTIPRDSWLDTFGEIDRDLLLVTDILIEDLSMSVDAFAKAFLDAIWNACGYGRCPAFDEGGNYIGIDR